MFPDDSSRPDFQILFYPVITMEEGVTHQGSRNNLIGKEATQELAELYSLENRVTERTPQAFIMVSADDRAVPGSPTVCDMPSLCLVAECHSHCTYILPEDTDGDSGTILFTNASGPASLRLGSGHAYSKLIDAASQGICL